MNKFLIVFLALSIFLVVQSNGVSAFCDSPAVFIDKEMYNVCYIPNVTQQFSLNITDNLNNTVISYDSEESKPYSSGTTAFYRVNFSYLQHQDDIDFMDFVGGNWGASNVTTKGTYYFLDHSVVITMEKEIFYSIDLDRTLFKNYGLKSIIEPNGSSYVPSGPNTVLLNPNTIFYNNSYMNYSITGRIRTFNGVNKTLLNYTSLNNLNTTKRLGINTSVSDGTRNNLPQIRNNNDTEMVWSGGVSNVGYGQNGSLLAEGFAIIIFDDSFFNLSDNNNLFAYNDNNNGTITTWATPFYGWIQNFADCDEGTSPVGNCDPWSFRAGSTNILYLNKVFGYSKTYLSELQDLAILHNIRLYGHYEQDFRRTMVVDYKFLTSSKDGVTDNTFNHTHSRLIMDSLTNLVEYPIKSNLTNTTINQFIYYLQNNKINDYQGIGECPHHTSYTTYYFSESCVINILTGATNSLITAKQMGYNVNSSIIDNYIRTYKLMYENGWVFNTTNPRINNLSYYRWDSNDLSYAESNHSVGAKVYTFGEVQDSRIIYLYNKSDSFRDISKKKINELDQEYDGNLTFVVPTSQEGSNFSMYWRQKSGWQYQQLNITSFDTIQLVDKYRIDDDTIWEPIRSNGFSKITNGKVFVPVFYPVFLMQDNSTEYIDESNSLYFRTPKYAMIPDFKFDSSLAGRTIWIKWAYNTTGNFTPLYYNYNEKIYDPQNASFIGWNTNKAFTQTTDPVKYWIGNISSSTTLNTVEGGYTSFLVDGVTMGLLNNTISISGSSTSKTITSNLVDSITVTAVLNFGTCEVTKVYYTPAGGSRQTLTPNSCSDGIVTLTVPNLPNGNSQFEVAQYCTTWEAVMYPLISLLITLGIIAFMLLFLKGDIDIGEAINGENYHNVNVRNLLIVVIGITVLIGFLSVITNILAVRCTL